MQFLTTVSSVTDSFSGLPSKPRKQGRTPKSIDLFRLAKGGVRFKTKKQARETLQNAGFTGTPKFVEALLQAVEFILNARRNRSHNRILKRLGHCPKTSSETTKKNPVLLPVGTPAERLKTLRIRAVAKVARELMRYGAAGGYSMQVGFAVDATEVKYSVTMGQNRDTYRGDYKGWSAREDHHLIVVPKDWRVRVERKGLADLAGMMILDAHVLIPDGDVLVYAATWARQGRGYDVKVEHGYVAMLAGEHFHAASAEEAIKGVRRKVKSIESPPKAAVSSYALTIDEFVKRYESRKFSVSVSDAEASGSCDFGIRSWCEVVGLDYEVGNAPLKAVLQGFKLRPQEEVRRAVLYAARRDRAERKLSVA